MVPAGGDTDFIARNLVDEAMFISDPTGPVARKVVLERLRFASPHSVARAVTSSTYELSASVEQQRGSQNELTIRLVETAPNGDEEVFEETISIKNNAAGTYVVGNYNVYVNTKGNNRVRELYVVNP